MRTEFCVSHPNEESLGLCAMMVHLLFVCCGNARALQKKQYLEVGILSNNCEFSEVKKMIVNLSRDVVCRLL